jgi:HD-GYP domain-containing protein (c-di-GMP phosphodiesterase class II)
MNHFYSTTQTNPQPQIDTLNDSIIGLALELEKRELEPIGHALRVVRLAESLGSMLRLSADHIKALVHAAYLHDVGNLLLPTSILLKPDKLEPAEWEIVKTHPRWSATIALGIPAVHPRAVAAILHHHERWDGSGYPDGLRGEQIPIESRILAVCDVYNTLVSKRAYGRVWSSHNALSEIQNQRSGHFDPKVVDAFLERALGKLA